MRHYANIVSEKAVLRRLIKLTEEIENDRYLNKEPVEVIMEETEDVQLLGQRNSGDFMIRQVVINTLENIERASKTKEICGYYSDRIHGSGLQTSGLQNSDFIPDCGTSVYG